MWRNLGTGLQVLGMLMGWAFAIVMLVHAQDAGSGRKADLEAQLKAIAAGHHGHVTVFARNLKTGETVGVNADEPVKTASVIKLAVLLDAAEQIRAGKASLDENVTLTKGNQVDGSGVLGEMDVPMALTLRDVLTLMVVLSDNTATNVAIDRLGLEHINGTIRAAGLKDTWLYKKVSLPPAGVMPADQPKFGLGKTTAREMAEVMGRIASCHLALDGVAAMAGDGKLCGECCICCVTSRTGTACHATLRHWIRARAGRRSGTRRGRSIRCGTMWPSLLQRLGRL